MRTLFLTTTAFTLLVVIARAEPLTYQVGPIVLPDADGVTPDYVVTGTITTNGTIGPIRGSDIISWSISVDGPQPYLFHPGNPGAEVLVSSVIATLTSFEALGHFGALSIDAKDNSVPNCSDCEQRLSWTSWPIGHIRYSHVDDNDFIPLTKAGRSALPAFQVEIATRVPEPLGLQSFCLGIAIQIFAGFRRHRKSALPAR